ncbi:MAG: MBL fold metallo-hydrolase [Planctomycetes bacterium RBG_16_64_10]|nr:MAG: MBL fold metallo-hydrolase [Planctomycetes bacterium RBG_16_64_10]
MATDDLQITTVVSDLFSENAYIARLAGRSECLVFDPGLEPDRIVAYLDQQQLTLAAILCTHGHSDHIAGNALLKTRWPNSVLVIGTGDAAKLTDPELNLSAAFGFSVTSPPADRLVGDGDTYAAAGLALEVRELPGHSVGHVVFLTQGAQPIRVFAGDVLFQGSIGRTDFADGSFPTLARAIHQKLFTLPDDTIILPGHGPPTTVGAEKRCNPFVGAPSGYRG